MSCNVPWWFRNIAHCTSSSRMGRVHSPTWLGSDVLFPNEFGEDLFVHEIKQLLKFFCYLQRDHTMHFASWILSPVAKYTKNTLWKDLQSGNDLKIHLFSSLFLLLGSILLSVIDLLYHYLYSVAPFPRNYHFCSVHDYTWPSELLHFR